MKSSKSPALIKTWKVHKKPMGRELSSMVGERRWLVSGALLMDWRHSQEGNSKAKLYRCTENPIESNARASACLKRLPSHHRELSLSLWPCHYSCSPVSLFTPLFYLHLLNCQLSLDSQASACQEGNWLNKGYLLPLILEAGTWGLDHQVGPWALAR